MEGTLTFLGTGTSMGVPTLGCACAVCTLGGPARPEAAAFGAAALAEQWTQAIERVVVIDTGPDFREQALRDGLTHVDAVFYTHGHADHILGMDDLRPLSFIAVREGRTDSALRDAETTAVLKQHFSITLFRRTPHIPRGRECELKPLAERNTVDGVEFVRIPVLHGEMQITGFRFGNAAYMTDVSAIPNRVLRFWKGSRCWCFRRCAIRRTPAMPLWNRRVAWARRIGAEPTWFTHIAHDLGHEETNRNLPENVSWPTTG